jgi:ribonucleoside-diphosphate reductase alpha subunit
MTMETTMNKDLTNFIMDQDEGSFNSTSLSEIVKVTSELVFDIISSFTYDLDQKWIDTYKITENIIKKSPDTMSLEQLYNFIATQCAENTSHHPDYNKLASRIAVKRLHFITPEDINVVAELLYHNRDKKGTLSPLISDEVYNVIKKHYVQIQKELDMSKDYNFDFFGLKTLERSYLFRIHNPKVKKTDKNEKDGQIIERPQHLIMRVALGIHGNDLKSAFETYHLISDKYFTHATPTLFNAGTNRSQLSSCFLLGMEDSIESIFNKAVANMAHISKWAGGIGVHITAVRAKGSLIRGTNGLSDGIIPLCLLLNRLAKYVNQGGKRNGSIACFTENTEVFTTNGGIKKIQDVKIGDLVVTHKNRVRPVIQVHKNPLGDRKIYKLEVEKNKDIYVTGNHKFWSCYSKKYKSNKISLGWNSIEELKNLMNNKETTRQSCYISIPDGTNIIDTKNHKIDVMDYKNIILNDTVNELKQIEDNKIIAISKTIDKKGYDKIANSQPINRIWNITEDLANLFGMWLGDGHIRKTHKDGYILGIGFTVHKDNKDEIEYINKICKETFDCSITSHTKTTQNITDITINSHMVGSIFMELFGSGFAEKKLPHMIFGWPKNLVNSLMAGLITTDGHITKEKCNASLGLSNEKLMTQLYHLCRNNGIDVSFVKYKAGKGMTCDPYSMSIPLNKEILNQTHKLYHDDRVERCRQQLEKNNGKENDTFLKILKITETDRKDAYVYTLGVEEDHSYTVEGLIAQNCYIEPWHADIFEFCELRKNTKDEERKARDLFLALWIPDLFMKRVKNNEMWSLMCPDECPNLYTTYGEEFERLYTEYEQEGRFKKQVKAADLFYHIMECQIETGIPYMLYKDHANNKSNQKNLGTIRSSNLCAEIVQYSDENEISVCNLASICLSKYVETKDNKKVFNFEKLMQVTKVIVKNLNRVIDRNFYPTPETKYSNMKNRPVGLGVQGLADVYNVFGFSFGSDEARKLNKQIFETIYYASLVATNELSKKYGSYSTFSGSPMSQGMLQYHMWGLTENDLTMGYDWKGLIENIKKYGVRNSLITAIMPTASTAQIMGSSECVEPYMSNVFIRATLAGEFVVINENLVRDLLDLNLWSDAMRKQIIINEGSVQGIDEIPQRIKDIYRTSFEVGNKAIITQSIERGPFIDQSQSLNLFLEKPDFDKLASAHFYGWEGGLKTGMYYLRSRPAVDPIQFGIDVDEINKIKNNKDQQNKKKKRDELDDEEDPPTKVCKLGKRGVDTENCELCSA